MEHLDWIFRYCNGRRDGKYSQLSLRRPVMDDSLFGGRCWKLAYAAICGSCNHGGGAARLGKEDLPRPLDARSKCVTVPMSMRRSPFHVNRKSLCRSTLVGRSIGRIVSLGAASSLPSGRKYPVHTKGDSHLRSAWELAGYEVWATDGEMGRVEGFIMDDACWHLGYLDVKAGDWLYSRSVLVPTRWVSSVSWADHRVNLHHAQA
jgi:hypothetical protein